MYESPVNTFYQQVQSRIENGIYEAIQNVGISVDRDELIKALQYDRNQYEKGYYDAKHEFASVIIDGEGYERCSTCNNHETGMRYFTFCPHCGSRLKE